MPQKNEETAAASRVEDVTPEEALKNLPMDEELEEGPLSGPPLKSRRDSRELVLKILYAQEISGNSLERTARDFLPREKDKYNRFAADLCAKIESGAGEIDELIVGHSEKWDFNRIAVLDKLILRMAIAEILYFPDIPPKVTINEAIEIAKKYSTENSSRFVNGILDAVFNDLKEKLNKADRPQENNKNPRKRG